VRGAQHIGRSAGQGKGEDHGQESGRDGDRARRRELPPATLGARSAARCDGGRESSRSRDVDAPHQSDGALLLGQPGGELGRVRDRAQQALALGLWQACVGKPSESLLDR
jgi:hypothetical protein